jgi:hydrogenase expression/formation protein HypC
MCLAVPMRVVQADGPCGIVETAGVRHEVRFDLVGEVTAGDFVLIHAGYAIQVMDEAAAIEQLAFLEELSAAGADPASPPPTETTGKLAEPPAPPHG